MAYIHTYNRPNTIFLCETKNPINNFTAKLTQYTSTSGGHAEEVIGGAIGGQVCLRRGGFAAVRVYRGRGGFGLKQSFRSLYNELPHMNWFETIIRVPLQSTILVVDLQDILVGFYLSGQASQNGGHGTCSAKTESLMDLAWFNHGFTIPISFP